ncbi:MAG: leucine-rich repeat domain-containing protein [Beutenbergiaceae bacterium]
MDLGTLTVGSPEPNPVVNQVGVAVPLSDARYESGPNSFTPTGVPGPGAPLTWSEATTGTFVFSGELTFTQIAPAATITIPDPALRACVNVALGQLPDAAITEAQAATINTLTCEGAGVADLTGIEYLTGLVTLQLANNDITDITALPSLPTVLHLGIGTNPISDVDALAAMTQLESLSINNLGLSDLTLVSAMSNLTRISFDDNQVPDLTPLAPLSNLQHIQADRNAVTDIRPLAPLTSLQTVFLHEQLVDLGELPIGTAVPNPIRTWTGTPIDLNDPRYDGRNNTFTPTGVPGMAPSLPWVEGWVLGVHRWTGHFTGELVFTQANAATGAVSETDAPRATGALANTGLSSPAVTVIAAGLLLLLGLALLLARVRSTRRSSTIQR